MDDQRSTHPLPVGTRVVTRVARPATSASPPIAAGAVGIVLRAPFDPTHAYRVRFVDGVESSYAGDDIVPLAEFQQEGWDAARDDHDLSRRVILRVVVGSRAYGLDHEDSDIDRRGCYLPSADQHWSLFGVPDQIEDDGSQEVFWELQKFLQLGLKANPGVLECLWSPIVEHASPLGEELRAMRRAFLSKLVFQTFSGYVTSQFRKLERDIRLREEAKPKHAMHLIRLLVAGTGLLRTGELELTVSAALRERLLDIAFRRLPWHRVDAWRIELQTEFAEAFASTSLPDAPDVRAVNAFLLRARRSALMLP